MSPSAQTDFDEDEEGTIDMDIHSRQKQEQSDAEDEEGTIDMADYSKSNERKEATWWDTAKDLGIQAGLGLSQAYTWPLDLLKIGFIGQGLSKATELENAFRSIGKDFDKGKYIQNVMEQGEFVPTQELLENVIEKQSGISLKPQTEPGKWINNLFRIAGMTKGKGIPRAIAAGVVGATTTKGLQELGAPEIVASLGGDVAGGLSTISKQARKLSPEAQRITEIAEKHGLPLTELMLKDEIPSGTRITQVRKVALEKELGMTTEEAIEKIKTDSIPISKLRSQGKDLDVLEQEAYDKAKTLAKGKSDPLNTDQIISDINAEIARIKRLAPSPSNAQQAAINVLESEKTKLSQAAKQGPRLGPDALLHSPKQKGKSATVEELIGQTQNYNSNVKGIYKKTEFSGSEEEVKNAYGFLNSSIRNVIEKEAGKEISDAYKTANKIFSQNAALSRSESILSKAFQNGEYNAKKLAQILNSKQGALLRRDLGEQGVKELQEIAEFGTKAQKASTQLANSAKHKFLPAEWGPLAGFLLAKVPPAGVAVAAAKPFFDYVRGWAITRPAARTVYRDIVKNAANGSFKNMASDFDKLEGLIKEEFGSIDDFMKQGISELQNYREGEEDED